MTEQRATEPWNDVRPASLERAPRDGWPLAPPVQLSAWSDRALRGLISAMLPRDVDGAPAGEDVTREVAIGVRRTLRYMAPISRLGLVALLWLLDLAPIWRLRAPARLSGLAPDAGDQLLEELGHSRFAPIRTAVTAVRAAVMTTYFDLPEVHVALDYAPVPFMRERIALRQRLLAGGAATDEDML